DGSGVLLGGGALSVGEGSGDGLGDGADDGDGLGGGGTPSSFAMSCWIFVISAGVSHSGYVARTIRSCFTVAFSAFPNSVTRFGSESRGRSVQTKPFAAPASAGASRIVAGPIWSRIASSRICWRCIRP